MNPRHLAPATVAAAAAMCTALLIPLSASAAAGAPARPAAPAAPATPDGGQHTPTTPIHHFVVLLQENHTFDNYFGTYPGADGIPNGVCMPVNPYQGPRPCVRPFHIGNQSIIDLDHSEYSARMDLHKGAMDGFVRAQHVRSGSGSQAMGYYNGSNVPFYWNVADRYVLFDHFFSSMLGGSFLNHVYWVAAGTGNATQAIPPGGLNVTTIFDRLQQAGISWKFYVQDYNPAISYRTLPRLKNANRASEPIWCPLLDIPRFLNTPALRSHIVDLSQYYTDLRDGTLPQVAYVTSSGASEHPPGSLTTGQHFVHGLVNSLMSSSAWNTSAFLLAYDDWGGWYDNVLPPHRDAYGDGFRVPAMLISPYARHHLIDHTTLDFTSMLKFIEQNWKLRPLTRLDATAGSLAGAFNFRQRPRRPDIIPLTRAAAPPAPAVRNATLYSLYGLGLTFALALILQTRRRRWHWPHRRTGALPGRWSA
jgi:phospholipase C